MAGSKGNCYHCGAELGKTAMKNHLLKLTVEGEKTQECWLIKVEGLGNKNYWLYLDMPVTSTLKQLDTFLRKIWLECCGHMSMFYVNYNFEIPLSRKLTEFGVGQWILYDYDFGDTTTLLITFVGITTRASQRTAVRLLARNVPFTYSCIKCGKEASWIDAERFAEGEDGFLCGDCMDADEDCNCLKITNSPRMGVCGYEGIMDTYAFDRASVRKS